MRKSLFAVGLICILMVSIFVLRLIQSNKEIHFDEMEMRTIAWNSLNESEKNSVLNAGKGLSNTEHNETHNPEIWKNSKVEIVKWKDIPMALPSTNQNIFKKLWLWYKNNDKAIRIDFNTSMDGLLGSIGIYLDPRTKKIIGYDLRL